MANEDKIKILQAEIKKLETSSLPADKDKAIQKQRLLNQLENEKYKFKKFVSEQENEK